MRLNFYSRRRRFNKSLLGSHKNAFVLLTNKKAFTLFTSKTITHSQPSEINIDKTIYQVVSSELLYIIIIRYACARVREQGVGCKE